MGILGLVVLIALTALPVCADEAWSSDAFASIDREVQALKQETLEINRELLQLEEELLYPPDRQLVVFLSLSEGTPLTLRRLRIELDEEVIVDHVYAESEAEALRRGGVHKPFIGKIRYGTHRLQALVIGSRGDRSVFRQSGTHSFGKGQGARYVELRIAGTGPGRQPELTIHGWRR